ncbi:MAG: acylneuraminate cytidylyltransferase family protein [Muribaculaceae bacterium]|nr:acylneuraminate cytidylyltransferase family protein [Muribaculaceae bacterium]
MELLITICGRGGSKGIPGKNIKELAGKPLIAYSIELAKQVAPLYGADIELSTDSEEIRKVAAEYGLPSEYVRPAYLANDTCGKPEAIRDVMLWAEKKHGKRYDYVLDLDVTSPLRTLEDVRECVRKIEENKEALTIFSVNRCARNPYFCQVEDKGEGFYGVVCDGSVFKSRQASPKVYDMNGSIYIYRRDALDCELPRAVTPRSIIYEMPHVCFDLDEPEDFEYMEWVLGSRLKAQGSRP